MYKSEKHPNIGFDEFLRFHGPRKIHLDHGMYKKQELMATDTEKNVVKSHGSTSTYSEAE